MTEEEDFHTPNQAQEPSEASENKDVRGRRGTAGG